MADGLPRLATHAFVLALTLVGAVGAPLGLHQWASSDAVAGVAANVPLPAPLERPVWRGISAAAQMRETVAASTDVASPADAVGKPTESLHHLARFVWPARGTITTYFLPYHPGIDIAAVEGTPELAADAGQVVFSGWGEYGIYVEIDHGNGFHTVYGHMEQALVQVGQTVSPGQEIGLMGSTGRSTGPHLHFEIRYQGVPQNPLDFLP
jgi:murein DD-endopeptidase MepM/ murein hydrolase activator NlpD